ncbi:bacterial luciferase-like protein [Lophiostoma macrostomum CBS 122681]|uniref:Bacterial luciferase-like protein n=1 Tax=Lophiostoma macrostomum CBS 122681 TaxID=1314788 RepID=A0A6A6T8U8_9PLEO|nr:bacterial luciferase-like protein [Lophiostoma macrostomum CBS 122681]
MPTEFISATFPNASTELNPIPGAPLDPDYLIRYARALDDYEYNYTLVPYDSSYFDPWTVGATIAAVTKKLKVIIALRPNTLYPTVAAKALTTLDQLSQGRVVVHFIAGGSDIEQAREGDFLTKEQRYERLEEYIKILRRAWESPEPFDWDGKHYQFKGFRNLVRPVNGKSIPVSVGGSSPPAYRIGGSLADIFGLWGEPLKETKEQIDSIYAEAEKAGRTDRPRIWVTFRPITAETEELSWQKAHKTLDALTANRAQGNSRVPANAPPPQNVGSQRLLDIASRGEVQDRALWYPTVQATGARGASTALVGSPQTIADSILDYVDLGAELISIRGYDNLNDAIDYGRYILPKVREGLKERELAEKTNGETGSVKHANGVNGDAPASEETAGVSEDVKANGESKELPLASKEETSEVAEDVKVNDEAKELPLASKEETAGVSEDVKANGETKELSLASKEETSGVPQDLEANENSKELPLAPKEETSGVSEDIKANGETKEVPPSSKEETSGVSQDVKASIETKELPLASEVTA